MRIYADFNGLLEGLEPGNEAVGLEGFGTLRDLNANQLRLHDGLALTLWSDSGVEEILEVEARVFWRADPRKVRGGHWLANFDPQAIRYLPCAPTDITLTEFPCGTCGIDLTDTLDRRQLPPTGTCPACGTPVGAALDQPVASA